MALALNQQLQKGKYTIERELGRGRFGITYLARNKNGNGVVIKTLNDAVLKPADFERWQQNFVKEAFKLAQCKHPNIVRAEEPFQEGGLWCIAMEYVEGIDLGSRAQNRLPEEEALNYIRQIGEALTLVHSHGLIHRDVKPANIMVRVRNGKSEAVLIDFGLAREFDHEMTQTRPEEMAEGFSPPELYSRKAKRGAYTDVYSLAATLYVLLTGTIPANARERKLSNERLVPPKDINPEISDRTNRAIIAGMEIETEKLPPTLQRPFPTQRPQTIQEWLDLLGLTNINSSSLPQPAANSGEPDWNKVAAVAGLVGLLIAAIGAIPGWMSMVKDFFQPIAKPSATTTPQSEVLPTKTPTPKRSG